MTTLDPEAPETTEPSTTPARRRASFGRLAQRFSLIVIWLLMGTIFFVQRDVPLDNFLQGIFARQTPLVFLGMAVVATMALAWRTQLSQTMKSPARDAVWPLVADLPSGVRPAL